MRIMDRGTETGNETASIVFKTPRGKCAQEILLVLMCIPAFMAAGLLLGVFAAVSLGEKMLDDYPSLGAAVSQAR